MTNTKSVLNDGSCPECGSGAVSEKGISVDGHTTSVKTQWLDCLNCSWDSKDGGA